MLRRPPISTRTEPLFPYAPFFRSTGDGEDFVDVVDGPNVLDEDHVQHLAVRRLEVARHRHVPAVGRIERPPAALALGRVTRDLHRKLEGKRSEEHTSELQSLMRISYAVLCLNKKTNIQI